MRRPRRPGGPGGSGGLRVLLCLLLLSCRPGGCSAISAHGCLFDRRLCSHLEVCIQDGLFGQCQVGVGQARPLLQVTSPVLQRLQGVLRQLMSQGLSWHDDLTQYVISQEMERIPRLRPPEPHPRDRSALVPRRPGPAEELLLQGIPTRPAPAAPHRLLRPPAGGDGAGAGSSLSPLQAELLPPLLENLLLSPQPPHPALSYEATLLQPYLFHQFGSRDGSRDSESSPGMLFQESGLLYLAQELPVPSRARAPNLPAQGDSSQAEDSSEGYEEEGLEGLREGNIKKNRHPDFLPYDHARIKLKVESSPSRSDYINASPIIEHDPRMPAYIATQGPLSHTIADFWQMVWESGCTVIVMLTPLVEDGVKQCDRYWPDEGSSLYHIYEVNLVSEHIWCEDFLVRSFYLKNVQTQETRTLTQFHFLSWPAEGTPASTRPLLDFRRKVNKCYRGRSCPIIVHCSDGAGRTGTYVLIDMVLNRMAKGVKEIDIAATLEHVRDQRPGLVRSKDQFEFALTAVAEEVNAILKALPQ
uniref:Protein tyrosine phosphatase receptor type N n=1 Tax=Myotis myotis TaxID=51298 RepID=A0A7J7WJ29_MYOMY|nr:protein tyrosine phosphatase receptor type N [Myotis myotis]